LLRRPLRLSSIPTIRTEMLVFVSGVMEASVCFQEISVTGRLHLLCGLPLGAPGTRLLALCVWPLEQFLKSWPHFADHWLTFPQPLNCSQSVSYRLTHFLTHVISSTLKMEAIRSFGTSVYNKPIWHHIPEDCVLQSLSYLMPYTQSTDTVIK
jgi:hypothetical protein